MATILTRSPEAPPNPSAGAAQLQRKPTKKSSFLSLKRDKKASSPADTHHPLTHPTWSRPRTGDQSVSPSSYHAPEEDALRPVISRPLELRERASNKRSSRSVSSAHDVSSSNSRGGKERQYHEKQRAQPFVQESYFFPSVRDKAPAQRDNHSKARSRPRSQTGPPRNQQWDHPDPSSRPFKSSLLDSASSVLSQYEDAPRTPIDELSFRDPIFSIPVMVAAPVPGVETMDALVDGMNHNRYGGDDHFMGSGGMSRRSKISKSGFHPLYHPPLPTPPPGVILGRAERRRAPTRSPDSDEDDDKPRTSLPRWSDQQRKRRPGSARRGSVTTVVDSSFTSRPSSRRSFDTQSGTSTSGVLGKAVVPSISEIIRAHAPPSQQVRSRKSSYSQSQGHATVNEQPEADTEVQPTEDESELVSRSSVDTIAEEVKCTIRNQKRASVSPRTLHHTRSFQQSPYSISDNARRFSSPRSEGRRESSIFSYSTMSDQPPLPPLELLGLTKVPTNSPSQAIAQYLRSARLTTLLSLTRAPHASRGNPLTVSLSDLGSPNGFPLVVFLGLGCVRHVMGLYDEMAECLGIRLITIDRWGLGRTDNPRSKSAKGIPEWASVVEEVLDQLHIDQCSIMAHSAGGPYALAFANKFPERIRGDVYLLAPWVGGGEGAGYKWLKYVPNGLLKTAQAAEWKVQAWMLGKPPTLAFEGIGFDLRSSPAASPAPGLHRTPSKLPLSPVSTPTKKPLPVYLSASLDSEPRPSMSSGVFSEYDDLRDFEGRFESRSTLERRSIESRRSRTVSESKSTKRKPSRGFLGRLKGTASASQPQSPQEDRSSSSRTGKKLKALRSMGSLKGRSKHAVSRAPSQTSQTSQMPWLPPPPTTEVGLGLDNFDWTDTIRRKSTSTPPTIKSTRTKSGPSVDLSVDGHSFYSRANGRRSVSFGAAESPSQFRASSPTSSSTSPASFQAALGNALIAASHAESSKGTHGDLLQILNHDRQPWGFSYSAYPHIVRVWYGDRDEKIAENAVRWMESAMGPDKCFVKVVKGADHALLYKSSVVVEVLEQVSECWRNYN
ncbi:hypothetical protein AcV7_000488 [Taiwanofungus camphoratus]|nr:hypothetical protein AcW2_001041 [Antrodia cinnamomea]KAI0961374.1 hypothetical protein AcV7_000488 [Antrodia cinnamomea]